MDDAETTGAGTDADVPAAAAAAASNPDGVPPQQEGGHGEADAVAEDVYEVGPDGLLPVETCVAVLISEDVDDEKVKICVICL